MSREVKEVDLNQWFEKGLTKEAYENTLKDHKEGFYKIYETFHLPLNESLFRNIKEKNLRAIIIAEPWCGHCMLNIPLFLKLQEKIDMPVRFILRDEHTELMDQYLTNEKRVIPIFIFIDESGKEVATWGPMAPYTKQFVDEKRKNLPDKESPTYGEAFQTFIQEISAAFTDRADIWQGDYRDIQDTLEQI